MTPNLPAFDRGGIHNKIPNRSDQKRTDGEERQRISDDENEEMDQMCNGRPEVLSLSLGRV